MHLTRAGRRHVLAVSTAVGVTATLLVGTPGASGRPPKPGPKPTVAASPQAKTRVTQQQVTTANAKKLALATDVGRLDGQKATLEAQLASEQVLAQQAEQKLALKVQQQEQAKERFDAANRAEKVAKAQLHAAAQAVVVAHARFVQYIQAAYSSGDVRGAGGSLLTASNPTSLLDQTALEQYQARAKADAIGGMQQATVAQSNAEAASRRAVATTKARKIEADRAKQAAVVAKQQADAAVAASQQRRTELIAQIGQTQQQLNTARTAYMSTLNARTDYVEYQRALAQRAQDLQDRQVWQHQVVVYHAWKVKVAQQQAAARAAARRHHSGGGGGGGGGGSTHTSSGGSAPSSGGWTAEKGRRAVARARSLLGQPYIWAGGNKWGPTTGGCTDPVAPCGVVGYDCSGLVMYAWGRNWAHYAATQFTQAGSRHPSPGNFKPGDLLFWSENGTIGGIGHVAIYMGHGKVIQAPQSGDVVKITPWQQVEAGYFGATRPLT